jgi:hypothetical protein
MPAPAAPLTTGDIAFRFHAEGPADLPDRPKFLKFSDRHPSR